MGRRLGLRAFKTGAEQGDERTGVGAAAEAGDGGAISLPPTNAGGNGHPSPDSHTSHVPEPPTSGVVVMPAGLVRELFRDVTGLGSARDTATATKPSRKRSAMLLGLGAALGSLLAALVTFLVVPAIMQGEPAKPVAVDDALAEYRSQSGSDVTKVDGAPTDPALSGDPAAAASGGDAAAPAGGETAGTTATGSGSGSGASAAGSPGAPGSALLRPPQGVYTYTASGTEVTKPGSLPAESTTVGPTIVGIVTHGANNCWTLEYKYTNKHSATDTFCPGAGSLTSQGSTEIVVSYGQKVANKVECTPASARVVAGMTPGSSWQGTCTVVSSGAANNRTNLREKWTFVGVDTVLGAPAWHIRGDTEASGDATGTSEQHVWFAQSNGMIVKFGHKLRMVSYAPFVGNAVYTEEIEATLKSLTPQT